MTEFKDLHEESKCIVAIKTAMLELGDVDWKEALDFNSPMFEDCEWLLTNLDEIGNGTPERLWYYNRFEDNNEEFADWVEAWFGPRWAKIAKRVEW